MTRDWAVHPGETLQEALDERGLKQAGLAKVSGWTTKHINQVCRGHAPITIDFALVLERQLGISARFWLMLQLDYDLAMARRAMVRRA